MVCHSDGAMYNSSCLVANNAIWALEGSCQGPPDTAECRLICLHPGCARGGAAGRRWQLRRQQRSCSRGAAAGTAGRLHPGQQPSAPACAVVPAGHVSWPVSCCWSGGDVCGTCSQCWRACRSGVSLKAAEQPGHKAISHLQVPAAASLQDGGTMVAPKVPGRYPQEEPEL